MEMMVRVAAVGITAAVLGAVLRKNVPELALLLALAAGLWILGLAAGGLAQLAALMEELAGMAGLSEEILEPLFKVVAISILTRLAVEICRGAGRTEWPPSSRRRGRWPPWRRPFLWPGR